MGAASSGIGTPQRLGTCIHTRLSDQRPLILSPAHPKRSSTPPPHSSSGAVDWGDWGEAAAGCAALTPPPQSRPLPMPRKYSALTRALQLETGVLNNAGLAGLKAPAPSVAAGAAAANGLGATLLATLQLCGTRPTHEVQDRTCCKARHPGCAGAHLVGGACASRGAQALHFPCRLRMYECEGEERLWQTAPYRRKTRFPPSCSFQAVSAFSVRSLLFL